MSIKLNIGAGSTVIEGFTPIDRKLGLEAFPLAYEDKSVDEIRASHILEHFSFGDAEKALKEWVRVLKPGGKIRLAVPDVDKVLACDNEERLFYLMGGQTDENDFHKSAYDNARLSGLMAHCGLANVQRWESPNTDTASHPISLNLEGFKPEPEAEQLLKIMAVVSIPRLGFNDFWGCVHEALSPFKIPVARFTGAFWGQCMQRALNDAVAKGVDWVLTLDYDTLFTQQHVDEMLGIMGNNPHIDALAALQARRAGDTPLMTVYGKTGLDLDEALSPIKVTTAHFGLTLIRTEALLKVAKPWFKAEPDADGEWGDDRLDDDIWFWHQWRLAGNSIYVAPSVRVGHMQTMVSQFDENMDCQLYNASEWRERNK